MKIIYISSSVIPSRSANSVHVMKMCHAFGTNGHDVILMAPSWKSEYEQGISDPYTYYGVKRTFRILKPPSLFNDAKIPNYAMYLGSILKIVKRFHPDLVYGRFPGSFVASFFGFPTIHESHAPSWDGHVIEHLFFKGLVKSRGFRKLVVVSDALKMIYIESGLLSDSLIQVAHDGADAHPDFLPLTSWPGRAGRLQIGYLGHLYKGRGIDLILELANRSEVADFHIVGGKESDIAFWKAQHTQTNVFFHGHVAPNLVYKYRNSCDLLLAPYQKNVSVTGGATNTAGYMSPLKIFEYMASKKAIIASDLPVLREVLNNKNAMLVESDNIDSWAQAISRLRDPEKRRYIAQNAYADFINNYQWIERAEWVLS